MPSSPRSVTQLVGLAAEIGRCQLFGRLLDGGLGHRPLLGGHAVPEALVVDRLDVGAHFDLRHVLDPLPVLLRHGVHQLNGRGGGPFDHAHFLPVLGKVGVEVETVLGKIHLSPPPLPGRGAPRGRRPRRDRRPPSHRPGRQPGGRRRHSPG